MLDDAARQQVLTALLVGQRHSWDQGLVAAVLEQTGTTAALRALLDDAVARQLPDGRLAELDPACAVNSAAVGVFVAREPAHAAAATAQRTWITRTAPRAADGTLFHLVGSRQVWADTVYMVVPYLAAIGESADAAGQLAGHRSRLRDPDSGLWAARWDEDAGRPADARAWGTGNGWVAAGAAQAVRRLPGPDADLAATEVHRLLDACLPLRRPDGLFGDVLDDPAGPADTNVASLLALAALTGAVEGWLPARYGVVGEDLLGSAVARVDALGRVTGASAAPHFDRPGHSPEAQAVLLLADGAHRRWRAGR